MPQLSTKEGVKYLLKAGAKCPQRMFYHETLSWQHCGQSDVRDFEARHSTLLLGCFLCSLLPLHLLLVMLLVAAYCPVLAFVSVLLCYIK